MQGLPFVRNGKTLLSAVDPQGRAERLVRSVPVKERTLYFCPSPLYGYGLFCFLSRLETEAPDSAVLCIEADPELYEFASQNIDSSIASNKLFHLTNVCGSEDVYSLVRDKWGARAFRRVEILRLTGGWQLFPELYDSVCETLRREIAVDWSNALTLTKMGRLYIRNALRNLPLVSKYPSAGNLSFGESPVLVLGAGPSLDETLDALKLTYSDDVLGFPDKRSFKIICVDTCLGGLKERNIVPDLAVILESQHWNINDFLTCRGWKVNAAIDLSSLPATANILSGERFLFFTPWTQLKIFERLKAAGLLPTVVPPLGSVGLTAVELSRRLTTGKIICAGLDFSFTQDKYHARSTPGHRSRLNLQSRLKRLFNPAAYNQYTTAAVSKSGTSVYTNPAMKNYRDLFEQEFGGDERIFDIEGIGLPLGVKTLSLKDAMAMLGKENLAPAQNVRAVNGKNSELDLFFKEEKNRLEELRSLLTGEAAADNERLSTLIEECDYLWAHFPDYAGGKSPVVSDISFLKRVRSEIDPMLKLLVFGF